jgi:hypothetical protein
MDSCKGRVQFLMSEVTQSRSTSLQKHRTSCSNLRLWIPIQCVGKAKQCWNVAFISRNVWLWKWELFPLLVHRMKSFLYKMFLWVSPSDNISTGNQIYTINIKNARHKFKCKPRIRHEGQEGVELQLYNFFKLGAKWGGWSTKHSGLFTLG